MKKGQIVEYDEQIDRAEKRLAVSEVIWIFHYRVRNTGSIWSVVNGQSPLYYVMPILLTYPLNLVYKQTE